MPSCHLTSSKTAWKSTPKCTWMCWRVWWYSGAIRWPVEDPGCGSRTRRQPTSPKRPRLGFRRSATTLYPSLTGPPPPPTWTWTTSFGHTSRTSPTGPPTTPKPAWSPPSAEYSPSSCRRLWKRHAPSSGSVSRWWLRLKAATMNRCQLFRTTILSLHPVKVPIRKKSGNLFNDPSKTPNIGSTIYNTISINNADKKKFVTKMWK